jgi:uncharacterized membrane protein
MSLESSKNYGGIGAILLFIGFIPYGQPYTGIIALAGLILVLIALYGFANIFNERKIFNNSLYGIIAGIVGAAIAGVVAVATFLSTIMNLLYTIFPSWNGDWSTLSGLTPDFSNLSMSDLLPLVGGLISVFLVLWIFVIIAAFFARRSLNALSAKTNVGLFSTAALLLLIGAFLTIVLIGILLIWIAVLLIAIAFFRIRTQPSQPMTTVAPPPSMPTSP